MRGVITHVYDLEICTACTTALKNIPDTQGFATSYPKIIESRAQLFLTFLRFPTTAFQSSFEVVSVRPMYLNGVADFSRRP